jgi:hypothetical protein
VELRFGVPVDCRDEGCGTLTRVVVDPQRWEVTHVVVAPPGGDLLARLVPIDLVAGAGDRMRLTCLATQWHELPYLEEVQYTRNPAEDYWGALLLWPLTGGSGEVERRVVVEHLPPGEAELSTKNDVRATDGHVGRLKGVVIDDRHRLTLLLVCEGHLWRKKQVAVPAPSLEAGADVLRLRKSC